MSENTQLPFNSPLSLSRSSILEFQNKKSALYEGVICTARWQEIRSFLSCFPLAATDFWGYEVRLHDPQAPADFLVCISRYHAKALDEALSEGSMLPFRWEKLLHFVKLWKEAEHLFHQTVKNIWLEMDAEEMQKEQPTHNLFYAPDPQLSHVESNRVAREFWKAFDVHLDSSVWEQFRLCQDSLPSQAIISQIGVMLARDKESLRFFAQGMDKQELFAYLNRIGWVGNTWPLQKLMDRLQPFIDTWGLNIELNKGGLRDGIGIECYLQADNLTKLQGLMTVFHEAGLITSEMQGLLHQYALQCSQQPIEKYREFVHHFKIAYRSDTFVVGKVYLGVMKNTQFFIHTLHQLAGM